MATSPAEPEGAKAQSVDTDYVLGCKWCLRLLDTRHAPTCPTYGTNRHPKQEARKVHVDECRRFSAAIDPKPRRR